MKALLSGLASLIVTGLFSCLAMAEGYCRPQVYPAYYPHCGDYGCVRTAPDMCGPGFYAVSCCGVPYGPNYNVHPPFPPVGGMPPSMNGSMGGPSMGGPMGGPQFTPHPFARGPRDYFMLGQ
jgi:hypothetical protein